MAAIPPFVWIGVGGLVIAVSLFVGNLEPFLILGALFILWGAARLLLAKARTDRPEHTYHTTAAEPRSAEKRRCFVCGTINHADANFCGHCGHRLT